MIKILALIPSPAGAVSFYRGLGPLLRMQKDHPDFLSVDFGNYDYQWCDIYPYDILFFIRPDTPEATGLIHKARSMGKRIWTDWDDLLWDTPLNHPMSPRYSDPKLKRTIAEAMSLSDACSFSTEYLEKRAIDDMGLSNTRLIRNAVDFEMHKPAKFQCGDAYMWRGSNTHDPDLHIYKDAIIQSVLKHDRHIHFYGSMPFFIFDHIPNFQQYPFTDLLDYFKNLRAGRYSMMLVPLGPDNFNLAKSNIAALEAITAGIIPIVPDTPEWAGVGMQYKGVKNMMEAIDYIESESFESREEIWNGMYEVVRRVYDLKGQNAIRANIIKNLAACAQ